MIPWPLGVGGIDYAFPLDWIDSEDLEQLLEINHARNPARRV